MNISKIDIYGRGLNKDEYGNTYAAYKAVIHMSYVSFYTDIIIMSTMTACDNYKDKIKLNAVLGINKALGWTLRSDDKRITMHYKQARSEYELEHPENWRI